MVLSNISDQVTDEMDKKRHSIGIFLDLSKVFDMIDHNILLNKLFLYGISYNILDWFACYLSKNELKVLLLVMLCGVHQKFFVEYPKDQY